MIGITWSHFYLTKIKNSKTSNLLCFGKVFAVQQKRLQCYRDTHGSLLEVLHENAEVVSHAIIHHHKPKPPSSE
jgi:hypothetical protein